MRFLALTLLLACRADPQVADPFCEAPDHFSCDAGCCSCPVPGASAPLSLDHAADLAVAADLDGDGDDDLVLAGTGVATWEAVGCGGLVAHTEAHAGTRITGLDTGDVDGDGIDEIVFMTASGALHAVDGLDLAPMFDATIDGLQLPGAVLAANLDTDGRSDAVAFERDFGALFRVANVGTGWQAKVHVSLPPGLSTGSAGDFGANERDEMLFYGPGGMAVIASVADFDYSDIQPLSFGAYGVEAAITDVDGDGHEDALVPQANTLEVWLGDGAAATLAPANVRPLAEEIVSLSAAGDRVAALLADGSVHLMDATDLQDVSTLPPAPSRHVLLVDLDGEGAPDVIQLDGDGTGQVSRR